jgi:hypothetical protein
VQVVVVHDRTPPGNARNGRRVDVDASDVSLYDLAKSRLMIGRGREAAGAVLAQGRLTIGSATGSR